MTSSSTPPLGDALLGLELRPGGSRPGASTDVADRSYARGTLRCPARRVPFPADRSWLASALWDHTWTDFGGSAELIEALQRDPIANARQVQPDQDAVPPGLTRE